MIQNYLFLYFLALFIEFKNVFKALNDTNVSFKRKSPF